MKKLLCLCLVILSLTMTACMQSRTPLTAEKFADKMEAAGYEIVDATGQFADGVVEVVYLAMTDGYQIEFYVVPSIDQAKNAYSTNKADFEALKSGSYSEKSVSVNNYSYYKLTSAGGYYVISQIDNTFIYIDADAEYKAEINEILEQLGY